MNAGRPVAALLLALLLFGCGGSDRSGARKLPKGGELDLSTVGGEPFHFSDHPSEVKLVYFGYTRCPSACPAALTRAESITELLRADGLDRDLLFVFVTIDPERDTPAKLTEYLDFFGVNGIALTGSEFEIGRAARRYGVTYERTIADPRNGYFFSHTTSFFLLDRAGTLRRVIDSEVPVEQSADWVKELLREPAENASG